jgi:Zn finger protein HypA/HybF involved in hydrogenase expression
MSDKCATCQKPIGASPSRILCLDCDADMLRARDEDDDSQNAREFFIRWAANWAREKTASQLTVLRAENERLKNMIYCSDCGGDVEDPYIDKYGEGPFCDICKDQRK